MSFRDTGAVKWLGVFLLEVYLKTFWTAPIYYLHNGLAEHFHMPPDIFLNKRDYFLLACPSHPSQQ